MAYTAFEEMKKLNAERYGVDIGPQQPRLFKGENELKAAAAEFIHNSCEELRFSEETKARENNDPSKYEGVSVTAGQIPFNMQKDVDRLCLERALERFLDSGNAEDAFDVYFCYIEMFIGEYENEACRRMVEKLSEFESNGSSLIMKHRDHYSHSVYVFTLGLAIYQRIDAYREEYKSFYGIKDDREAAWHFLQYWGLASLFHDIGYPFELPFEQIISYFAVSGKVNRSDNPYISFNEIKNYITVDGDTAKKLKDLYGMDFADSNALFAYCIAEKLGEAYGKTEQELLYILNTKPLRPSEYSYYMDHAYFSASVLFKTLCDLNGCKSLTKCHIDAMTAIILHNSLYKFSVTSYKDETVNKPFKAELHPLAYLLMLCDELQCWDRTSYGRNSRSELHPMDCTFSFEGNKIVATYWHDAKEIEAGKTPKLNAKAAQQEIGSIVSLDKIGLEMRTDKKEAENTNKNLYISQSNFIHLYNFAAALNSNYNKNAKADDMINSFDHLSLEYKLSNIGQAKAFSKHLNAIGCFYTDRPVDFPMLTAFTDKDADTIGPLEHERWLREHIDMGWVYSEAHMKPSDPDDPESEIRQDKPMREQTRGHHDMVELRPGEELTHSIAEEHYKSLHKDEQAKDTEPMNIMLKLIKEFDGLRIYRYK